MRTPNKVNSAAWWTCEGGAPQNGSNPTRRQVIQGGIAAALAAWSMTRGQRSALAQISVNPNGGSGGNHRDVLVTIFLRGGADGLSIVVPHGDEDYYRARPTIALARPDAKKTGDQSRVVNLDGFFGLHPALAALQPLYENGLLAPIHGCGSFDQTRSHFEAMATMERGLSGDERAGGMASGWLARHLTETQTPHDSPLRAVAFGGTMPDSLRGATGVSALSSLNDFRLAVAPEQQHLAHSLAALYHHDPDENAVTRAGRETLAVLDALKRIDPAHYKPANSVVYPKSELGDGLRQVACLIKGDVGLEVAALDRGGWDTHVAQGTSVGWMALQLADVGNSIAAFANDLGKAHLSRVTTVVMTEFGRRVQENSGLGTDHGRASAMLVLGGGIHGGKVYAHWAGLSAGNLEPPGDLKVTIDYRDVLGEIVAQRLGNSARLARVFPGETPKFLGIAKPLA